MLLVTTYNITCMEDYYKHICDIFLCRLTVYQINLFWYDGGKRTVIEEPMQKMRGESVGNILYIRIDKRQFQGEIMKQTD